MDVVTALLKVTRVSPRKRHGGFYSFGATTYELEGSRVVAHKSHGRHFVCVCGEPFVDGDRLLARTDIDVHANCEELVT